MTYWEQRFLNLKEDGLHVAQSSYEDLTSIYAYSLNKYENQIAGFIQRYANSNNLSLADAKRQLSARELKDFKITLNQYIKLAQQKNLSPKQIKLLDNASLRARLSRLEELWIHTSQFVEILAQEQHTNINDALNKVYNSTYYEAAYLTQSLQGKYQTFRQIPKKAIQEAINTPWGNADFSQRIWDQRDKLITKLQQEITRSFIAQEPTERITERISQACNVQMSNARRLVETEVAYVQELALNNTFKELNVKQYQILATLDKHTSSVCRHLDKKVIDRTDFKPGITAPPFHPYCRSTMIPYVPLNSRASRPDTKTEYVPDISYEEWEATYLK